MTHVFKVEEVEKVLNAINKTENVNRKFSIMDNFIKINKARSNLIPRKVDSAQIAQLDDLMTALIYIKDNGSIPFFINYQE
ncbi:MAG: hypothetical protein MJ233_03315 [Mycoplasmoidaceae bacterium]|nr:hypothetical protein [Mycoplasmoidaceae bacterium]